MSWFYAEGGVQKGPVTDEVFRGLVAGGTITAATLVWRAGMSDWQPYGVVSSTPPPPDLAAPGGVALAGDPALPAAAAAGAPTGPAALTFTGDASEYFKIWIVNLLLTVATLGIYAAWAKVRTKRYFYANTRLLGHAFEYLADPVRILIGNIIVIVLLFALNFSQTISLPAYFIILGIFLIATPWFIVRALMFNARNSAWRGLRFQFRGRYAEALKFFVLFPLLVVLSLGIAYPWVAKQQREWVVNRHGYGSTGFSFTGEVGEFYRIYLTGFALMLPLILCYAGIFALAIPAAQSLENEPSPLIAFVGLLMLPALMLAYCGFFYLRVHLFNYSWNNTQIGGHRFRANMRFWDFFGLQFLNGVMTGLTFGLMYPWARVRVARFIASSLLVIPDGSIDQFVAAAQSDPNAIGEAGSDILDLNVGIDFGL